MTKARDLADAGNYDLADFGDFDFPASDGTNGQALVTDGSGNLSFADAGGGKVLQVAQAIKKNRQSISSSSYVDISGLSVNITPSSTSSKILVFVHVTSGLNNSTYGRGRIYRGTTPIANGDAQTGEEATFGFYNQHPYATNTTNSVSACVLDSPNSTSQQTYSVKASTYEAREMTINYNPGDANTTVNMVSSITVMEVGA